MYNYIALVKCPECGRENVSDSAKCVLIVGFSLYFSLNNTFTVNGYFYVNYYDSGGKLLYSQLMPRLMWRVMKKLLVQPLFLKMIIQVITIMWIFRKRH